MELLLGRGGGIDGDLYFDFEGKGNALSRPALDRLFADVTRDRTISHVFIKQRDRLARPDDPHQGTELEKRIRRLGVTLVFDNLTLGPLGRGPGNLGEEIVSLVDYHEAGAFRTQLAQKLLDSQLERARQGLSIGGPPPFGFRRWLIGPDGQIVRELGDGEWVRIAGHHIVWLPGPEEELRLIRRILDLLETVTAAAVARLLTREGVPSPHAGRVRKDKKTGAIRPVSGVWHANSISSIARHPLVVGLTRYGPGPRRSPGRCRAAREAARKTRCPRSDSAREEAITHARAEPPRGLADRRRRLRLAAASSESRGRNPDGTSYLYKCGLCQQSSGAECSHNRVKGPQAVRFLLNCLRQRALRPDLLATIEASIRERARREAGAEPEGLREAEAAARGPFSEVKVAGDNLARAGSAEEFSVISGFRAAKAAELEHVRQRIETLRSTAIRDVAAEVAAALVRLHEVDRLAEDDANLPAIAAAFDAVNAKLYCRFRKESQGKRSLNKLAGGVVTFGDAPPPVPLYTGATARSAVRQSRRKRSAPAEQDAEIANSERNCFSPIREADSLGNVNRDDRIRTCGLLLPKNCPPAVVFSRKPIESQHHIDFGRPRKPSHGIARDPLFSP